MLEQGERMFTVDSAVWRTVASEYGYRLVEWHAMSRVYENAHWILRGFGRWRVAIEERTATTSASEHGCVSGR